MVLIETISTSGMMVRLSHRTSANLLIIQDQIFAGKNSPLAIKSLLSGGGRTHQQDDILQVSIRIVTRPTVAATPSMPRRIHPQIERVVLLRLYPQSCWMKVVPEGLLTATATIKAPHPKLRFQKDSEEARGEVRYEHEGLLEFNAGPQRISLATGYRSTTPRRSVT